MRPPPEWAPQDWLWIGFPHAPEEWPGTLASAQREIAAFADAISETGQEVRLLVRDAENEAAARALVSERVRIDRRFYGDIWLRDTGPIVVEGEQGRQARLFRFNGWGGKYRMPGDETIGAELAASAGLEVRSCNWVLEGGAVDGDGTGRFVTTEQCLLNPNRNPELDRGSIEALLAADLGATSVLWLGDGLAHDHTDGHVDNLARFVAPGVLALPRAAGPDDPNAGVYADASARARAAGLAVAEIPSPGAVRIGGEPAAASYMNFLVATELVVVPIYDAANDDAAIAALADLFPRRSVIGLPAAAVLSGGGSFHCASQQMPSARPAR